MKRISIGSFTKVFAGIVMWSLGGAVAVQAQIIKMGTVVPVGSPWHESLLEISEAWKQVSDGTVRLRIYPGGVAGDEPDMLRKMRIGQLHAAALTSIGLISVVPDIEAITFPMQVRSDDELDQVIERVGPVIEKQLEAKGFKVLTWTTAGWVHFFSKRPVIGPEDLRMHKLFFWGSDTAYVGLLKDLGFTPVSLSVTDLLPSLQTGMIDAFAAPPVAALSFQWFGPVDHMSEMLWQPMASVTVITLKAWKKIPTELRPRLEMAASRTGKDLQRRSRELEEQAVREMERRGLKVQPVPVEAVEKFRRLIEQHAIPKFVGDRISPELFGKVQAVLNEFRQTRLESPTRPDAE